jgi:hypothetical protein
MSGVKLMVESLDGSLETFEQYRAAGIFCAVKR